MGGGTTQCFGIESPGGLGAEGYCLTSEGKIGPFASGRVNKLDTPEGTWLVGKPEADGLNGDRTNKYRLYPLGTSKFTTENVIPDPRAPGGTRTYVEGHTQHGVPGSGSLGCIAHQNDDVLASFGRDKQVTVDYSSQSLEEVQKKIEKAAGKDVDWTKIKKPVPPRGSGLPGDPSKTKKGSKVKAEDTGVGAGKKQHRVAHRQASLLGGGEVTRGTASITVGRPQYLVSAVSHDTTDGSPIATGEDSVHMIA
jgi:hypothetical protein